MIEEGAAADDAADEGAAPSMGVMHDSIVGRFVLSVLLGILVLTLIVWNLPKSEIRDSLRPIVRPYVNALAIDQRWSLFSPNPSTISIEVTARVELADGSVATYSFPDGDPVFGAFREYRWRKFERRLRLDSNDHLWEPASEWVASQYDEPIEAVVLVRRFSHTPEPGSGAEREWGAFEFYRYEPDGAGQ